MPSPLKRYLVFAGEDYYPVGGWSDFVGSYDSFSEAKKRARRDIPHGGSTQWSQVYDTVARKLYTYPTSKEIEDWRRDWALRSSSGYQWPSMVSVAG